MGFARLRIRTLLVATASVATGYTAMLNYIAYMNADRLGPIPRNPAEEFTAAAAIAAVTHVATSGLLALLPRMTARWWTIVLVIGIGIATTLVAVKVHQSRVADEYRAIAENHSSQFFALIIGKKWSGSFIDINGDDHFIDFNGGNTGNEEELKGRDLAIVLWHSGLADKYQSAAERPWLHVPPDPPKPD
jgi:hypothetical protein